MRKNLLDKTTAEEIVTRAKSLQRTDKGNWGTMEVTEMLHHCNLANKQILHGDIEYKKSSLKQHLLRFLSLYIVPKFLKNIKGAERNDTKGKISADEFEQEKIKFISLIHQFATHKDPIELTHPAFGNLKTRQWGVAAWMHMDHHLRQFGA